MSKQNLERFTLFLRPGDKDYLMEAFPKLGAGGIIRKLVSGFVDQHNAPVTDEELEALQDE